MVNGDDDLKGLDPRAGTTLDSDLNRLAILTWMHHRGVGRNLEHARSSRGQLQSRGVNRGAATRRAGGKYQLLAPRVDEHDALGYDLLPISVQVQISRKLEQRTEFSGFQPHGTGNTKYSTSKQ